METAFARERTLFPVENKNEQSMTGLGAFASSALGIGSGREEELTHQNQGLCLCLFTDVSDWDIFKVRVLFGGSYEFTQDVTEVQKSKVITCLTVYAVLLRNNMESDGNRSLKQREDNRYHCIFSLIHMRTSISKHLERFYNRMYKLYVRAGLFIPACHWLCDMVKNSTVLSNTFHFLLEHVSLEHMNRGGCLRCNGKISAGEM